MWEKVKESRSVWMHIWIALLLSSLGASTLCVFLVVLAEGEQFPGHSEDTKKHKHNVKHVVSNWLKLHVKDH